MACINWDRLLLSLVLVRLGQDLGTDGPLARAVSNLIDVLLGLAA